MPLLHEFVHNFTHNLFKPLLLFFYAGFLIPVFRVKFEFPKVIYQGLTIYLLLAIGWHGGEELAMLGAAELRQALGFMLIGMLTNSIIGFMAYWALKHLTRLRRIDAATVAGYYGSDSAGTFLTAVGVLTATHLAYAAYMPVMLAVMEIPGCLVALFLISRMRRSGMDALGNMPGEANYSLQHRAPARLQAEGHGDEEEHEHTETVVVRRRELVGVAAGNGNGAASACHEQVSQYARMVRKSGGTAYGNGHERQDSAARQELADEALETDGREMAVAPQGTGGHSFLSKEVLHEVFFNPGIYLLFAGITIGFVSRLQGASVTMADDELFIKLFQGLLCLFLLEMGMTASKKLKDLKAGGWQFITFGLLAPNVFAATGIIVAHLYSMVLGQPFEIGTYVLFAVLCGAASYIAVPAVQRMAIPEASPTLPLAASLGLTFSYNVTVGIPVYILIAKVVTTTVPIAEAVAAR